MKKLIFLTSVFLYCLSCSGQDSFRHAVDSVGKIYVDTAATYTTYTVPAILLVSNISKKQAGGVWCIKGYVVLAWNNTTYLGRKRKPIPKYIHVWNYTIK